MSAAARRSLEFVDPALPALADAIERAVRGGAGQVWLTPPGAPADALRGLLSGRLPPTVRVETALPPVQDRPEASGSPAVCALVPGEGQDLSGLLLQFLDWRAGPLIAPRTARVHSRLPLFVVSIPKSGTHLLYGLARQLGYRDGVELKDFAKPAHWYCLEYSNSHTAAPDFFIDSVRRNPFGNRAHPFPRTPTLFIYRNPLDVWVSEANYYHKDGNASFHGYLSGLDFEGRLERLLADPWLLGTLRERIGRFLAWLDFPNVIPLSYEELVGARGGGDDALQEDLVWSIQLKLQAAGEPARIGAALFDESSPTFHRGSIDAYRGAIPQRLFDAFLRGDQDFMRALGYAGSDLERAIFPPARAAEFRRRPLTLASTDHDNTPMIVDTVFRCNLVQFRRRFYAVPQAMGPVDLARMPEETLQSLVSAENLPDLRNRMLLGPAGFAQALQRVSGEGAPLALGQSYRGFRLFLFGGKAWAAAGAVDFSSLAQVQQWQQEGRLVCADSIEGATAAVDRSLDLPAVQARLTALEARETPEMPPRR